MARRLAEMNTAVDNRHLLPLINNPCLIMTRTEDAWMSPENSRYLAEHIPEAQLLELPGVDHDPWVGDTEPILQAVREFLDALDHPFGTRRRTNARSKDLPSQRRREQGWAAELVPRTCPNGPVSYTARRRTQGVDVHPLLSEFGY
jgi:hypothetical protein